MEWTGANGKTVKAPPATVKTSHSAELKAFKADLAAAATMITAQKLRFDSFYLPGRVWTLRQWRERFATHPLQSNIALRLIWQFSDQEQTGTGIWSDAQQNFVDVADKPLLWLTDATEIRLWHPIGMAVAHVVAWRDYLHQHSITQPFKQAYRAVYLLTEAEGQTATYSNRFAAHIVKQHQMHSLATLRGWRSSLHIMAEECRLPATKIFPEYGLRAEFWIAGVGETYGTDTTDAGAFFYLATDQVRFYRSDTPEHYDGGAGYSTIQAGHEIAAAPGVPLTEIPDLLFSEVMRDIDLFIGVCSVGNDATC